MYNNYYHTKKRNNGINTADISNQLHWHLANRARLQQEQDNLWHLVKSGRSCVTALDTVDRKIGENTYAIDGLIGRSCWINSAGVRHYYSTFAYRYLAKKKQKTAQLQRQLSQLMA